MRRPTSATPRSVSTSSRRENSAEIGGVGVADATTHLGHTEIGLDGQPAGLRHAVLHDPVLHGSAGLSTYRGCQVPRTEVHCLRDVAEGQWAAEALLDHREYLIQKTGPRSVQLFTLAGCQACGADKQQHELGDDGLAISLPPLTQLTLD